MSIPGRNVDPDPATAAPQPGINALAKLLKRNYKNVHEDVKALESIGLIEQGEDGRYSVPWDEINTSFKLAV